MNSSRIALKKPAARIQKTTATHKQIISHMSQLHPVVEGPRAGKVHQDLLLPAVVAIVAECAAVVDVVLYLSHGVHS